LDLDKRRTVPKLLGPMNVRSTSLATLAILATIFFLRAAEAVFIPITLAVVTACAIAPIIDWLRRVLRVPRPLGAAATLLVLCALLAAGANALQPQLMRIVDVVPRATAQLSAAVRASASNHNGALRKINRAATELERAVGMASNRGAPPVTTAAVAPTAPAATPTFIHYAMMGTANALAGVGQLFVVLSLVFFLLISGDGFRVALLRACGPSLARKRTVLRTVALMVGQVQRYLLLMVVTSALLGVAIGAVFAYVGLDNALFWACCGALLHLVPYIGPAVFVVVVAMVSYVQFNAWVPVVTIAASVIVITGIIGMLLVPWLTGRVGRLNVITVFVSLLFWGWLWGVWGLLLGIPIVMALNAICEHAPGLQIISEFLSGPTTRQRRQRGRTPPAEASAIGVQPGRVDP
jgi:predicted PurR-regulated permease PerM